MRKEAHKNSSKCLTNKSLQHLQYKSTITKSRLPAMFTYTERPSHFCTKFHEVHVVASSVINAHPTTQISFSIGHCILQNV